MINLIRKDFTVMKSWAVLIPIYFVIFGISLASNNMSSFYLTGVYSAVTTLMMSTGADVKNENHNFLMTMPINRAQIVRSKYMLALIYTGVAAVACYGLNALIRTVKPDLGMPAFTLEQFFVSVEITLVFVSIYLPLFYLLSKNGMTIANIVFIILLIYIAPLSNISMHLMSQGKIVITDTIMALIALGVVLVFIASYYIAKRLFSRKDL